jgi:tetratricopeptide (TPR) repeat protein
LRRYTTRRHATPCHVLLLVGVALLGAAVSAAAAGLAGAERLYEAGDYAPAEELFRRHLVEHPSEEAARFRAGQAAFALGRYIDAAADFELLARDGDGLAERARFMKGLASYRLGEYSTAADQWSETVRLVQSDDVASAAQYGRAWCAIRRHQWSDAGAQLSRLSLILPDSREASRASLLHDALRDADALPMRSPRAAKWLSTGLPGAGQLYAGRAASGMVSLGLNAGFFYFLARAVADARWVDATFIYVAGSRFYWGGRQNAEKFAVARNARARSEFVSRLAAYEF